MPANSIPIIVLPATPIKNNPGHQLCSALRMTLDTISARSGGSVAHLTLVVNWTPVLMTNGRSGCIGMQGCRSTTKALEGKEKGSGSHTTQWASPCPVPRKSANLVFKDILGRGGGGWGWWGKGAGTLSYLFIKFLNSSTILSSSIGRCCTMGSPL